MPLDVLEMLAGDAAKAAVRGEENRKRYPAAARFKDAIEAEFGKTKLIYAEEGGERIGKEQTGWIDARLIVMAMDFSTTTAKGKKRA